MPTNSKAILVAGGAGYIGSHMVLLLRRSGFEPVVLDNLSTGHRDAIANVELIEGDVGDKTLLAKIFAERSFSAVMHFASCIEVAESVQAPLKYYQNNVAATLNLLEVMQQHQVNYLIFSSSAAVYGEPRQRAITETHPLDPINPYGRSKRMVEDIIRDVAAASSLKFSILRYFNAAGADPEARVGERHQPETHLIPLILQAAARERENITIYGSMHATADGTCIRDYVHVSDICNAHLLALHYLQKNQKSITCNLGTGNGYSVLQVIKAAQRVTGQTIRTVEGAARPGDPDILVAEPGYAQQELKWHAKYNDLDSIISHAWQFKRKLA